MKSSFQLLSGSALSLFFVTLISLLTAYVLGPVEFGFFAACQALSIMLMPLVCFRFETRVAVCKTNEELSELSIAIQTGIIIFLSISSLALLALSFFIDAIYGLMIVLLAAGIVLVDFELSKFAFLKMHKNLAIHRFLRQVLPVFFVLIVSYFVPQHQFSIGALLIGTWVYVFVLGQKKINSKIWSFQVFKKVLITHLAELRASLSLGMLNGLWLNGLQPLMTWMGLHQLSGQFALLQKIINAPLAVISVVVNSHLLEKGNLIHTRRAIVLKIFFSLVLIGAVWTSFLWLLSYEQSIFILPKEWIPNQDFFVAASFFGVFSFAVGSLSLISIRLRDEWFVAVWQLVFMLTWVVALFTFDPMGIFTYLLFMGGVAYVFLMWRWIWLITASEVQNVDFK